MIVCFKCGKAIKGKRVHVVPSNLARYYGDFIKEYHPACWEKEEKEAEKELNGN